MSQNLSRELRYSKAAVRSKHGVVAAQNQKAADIGAEVLRAWAAAQRDRHTVVYDVNVRPALLPDRARYGAAVEPWLKTAHVVKASGTPRISPMIVTTIRVDWRIRRRTARA